VDRGARITVILARKEKDDVMLCVFSRLSALLFLLMIPAAGFAARPSSLHWARLPVVRALPSQVFARLGIGHITRRGYTRDGAKKTDPDPTFPVGLTDIVPLDAEHLLLVRGTDAALAAFKLQVAEAQTQVTAVRWHIAAQLVQAHGGAASPVGPATAQDASDALPVTLLLGARADRAYQVRVLPNAQGMLEIVWQRGLALSGTAAAPGVLAPDVAWSAGVSRTAAPSGTVTFDDLAADRVAARQALGLPPDALGGDYGVRVTVTPLAAPVSAAPLPMSPVSPAP